MHSEVEKLLVELRAEVRNDGVVVAAPTDLNLRAASLIETLYRREEALREALKAHLREHWLASIVCDHEAKTDTAICACSQWRDEPHPSVGAAVDAWIDHVFAALAGDHGQ